MWWFEKCLSINHYKSLNKYCFTSRLPTSRGANVGCGHGGGDFDLRFHGSDGV